MERVDRVVIELENWDATTVEEIARRCRKEYRMSGVRVYVEYQDARRVNGATNEPR